MAAAPGLSCCGAPIVPRFSPPRRPGGDELVPFARFMGNGNALLPGSGFQAATRLRSVEGVTLLNGQNRTLRVGLAFADRHLTNLRAGVAVSGFRM